MNGSIPFTSTEQCIHDRFDSIAALFPDRPAVSDPNQRLSYRDLQLLSNKIAHIIIGTLGAARGNIGLLIENNVHQVAAIIGILKSGCSYVALDAGFPAERNRIILLDSECKMLLCTRESERVASEIAGGISLVFADGKHDGIPESQPQNMVDPKDNAITLYTSGSTGRPKGVVQSHRNMVHFIKRMTEPYPIHPDDKVAYYLSVAFSAHALPLLGALLTGGELKTYTLKTGNYNTFSNWFRDSRISFAMMIPSFLRHFIAAQGKKDRFPDLRLLMIGGETLYRSDVLKAKKVFGNKTMLVNIYASTEAYLMSSFAIGPDTLIKTNIVPIGFPAEGMELEIVDEEGHRVKGQQRGEIILKSEYVTEGYWKQSGQSSGNFFADGENKNKRVFRTADAGYYLNGECMMHAGRKDDAIKLRGYRIDLGEIINILLQHTEVVEASCALKTDPQGNGHLVAYIVNAEDKKADTEFLHASLVRMLPDYMIPSHILAVPGLPRNSTGKIDRSLLPEPLWRDKEKLSKTPPADEIEKSLVDIFERVLKISPIGTDENFLKLGANSLSLFVAFSEVEKYFKVRVDIRSTVDNPDIRSLASLIRKGRNL